MNGKYNREWRYDIAYRTTRKTILLQPSTIKVYIINQTDEIIVLDLGCDVSGTGFAFIEQGRYEVCLCNVKYYLQKAETIGKLGIIFWNTIQIPRHYIYKEIEIFVFHKYRIRDTENFTTLLNLASAVLPTDVITDLHLKFREEFKDHNIKIPTVIYLQSTNHSNSYGWLGLYTCTCKTKYYIDPCRCNPYFHIFTITKKAICTALWLQSLAEHSDSEYECECEYCEYGFNPWSS